MSEPNVIFIFADQLRHTAVGSSANTVVQTPRLDRLAQHGLAVDQAFSNCPLRSSYRGRILTGLHPHRNGVLCNEYKMRMDVITLPQAFKKAG